MSCYVAEVSCMSRHYIAVCIVSFVVVVVVVVKHRSVIVIVSRFTHAISISQTRTYKKKINQ